MSVTTPTIITAVSITTYSDNRAHCIISHLGPTPDAIPPHTGNPDFLDLLHQSYPCTNEISLTHTQLNQPARTDLPPATKPEFSIFFWNDNRTELDHDHLNKIAEAWYHQQKAWHTFTDDLDSTNNASQVVTIPEPEPPIVSESATPTEPATPSPKNDILGPRPGEPPPWSRKAKTQAGLQPDATGHHAYQHSTVPDRSECSNSDSQQAKFADSANAVNPRRARAAQPDHRGHQTVLHQPHRHRSNHRRHHSHRDIHVVVGRSLSNMLKILIVIVLVTFGTLFAIYQLFGTDAVEDYPSYIEPTSPNDEDAVLAHPTSTIPPTLRPTPDRGTICYASSLSPLQVPVPTQVTVVRVTDGDTVIVDTGLAEYITKIWGVDAPELNQTHGPRARLALLELLPEGATVDFYEVAWDPDTDETSGIFFSDTGLVNLQLIGNGWGYADPKWDGAANHCILEFEQIARKRRYGVWADNTEGHQRPWEYRSLHTPTPAPTSAPIPEFADPTPSPNGDPISPTNESQG